MKHYVIYSRVGPHPVVYLLRAGSVEAAVRQYCEEEVGGVEFRPDGSVVHRSGRTIREFPHVLALIEGDEKRYGEWQIREVRDGGLEADCEEVLCGEDPQDVEYHVARCRPLLRRDFPRSRLPAFLWYLRGGVLVTFYRKRGVDHIEVVRRYYREWKALDYTEWHGTYAELLDRLFLRWWDRDEQ